MPAHRSSGGGGCAVTAQCRNAIFQLQWRERDLVDLGTALAVWLATWLAVPVGQHLFGLKPLQQATAYEGAQDAFAQGGLHFGHSSRIHAGGLVKNDARRVGLHTGLHVGISTVLARHFSNTPSTAQT